MILIRYSILDSGYLAQYFAIFEFPFWLFCLSFPMFCKRNISFIYFVVWITIIIMINYIIKIIINIIISHDEKLQYVKNCLGGFERGTGSIKHKIMHVWLSQKSSQIPFVIYV